MALIGLSLVTHAVALFFIGSTVAGVGFGTAFSAQVQQLAPLARPHERAELFAAMYVVSYLAFSVPAMSAGLLIAPFGLLATALGYLAFLPLVAGSGAALQWAALGRPRASSD